MPPEYKETNSHFTSYIGTEHTNFLTNWHNYKPQIDLFTGLDGVYRKPLNRLETESADDMVPRLYLYVHYHLFSAVSALLRNHISEALSATRIAIEASFTAYKIILEPENAEGYENGHKDFLYIKGHIKGEREKDSSRYPLASGLIAWHELCSQYGSHADIKTFVHRLKVTKEEKYYLQLQYFQFPEDQDYIYYFVKTLIQFMSMFMIFQIYLEDKLKIVDIEWNSSIVAIKTSLDKMEREYRGSI